MKLTLAFILFFWTSTVSEVTSDRLIVWNVGQGLWVTVKTLESCTHIDMGGEKIDWKKVSAICGSKKSNQAVFSHWDLDHINFAERASKRLSGFCVLGPPRGPSTESKRTVFSNFPKCNDSDNGISELKFNPLIKENAPSANDFSRIYEGHLALFPGDSTSKQERIWSSLSSKKLKYLVLGHHGSKTSTSEKLLKHLPELRLAIASARKKRYGHPHRSVVENLKLQGVSTLSTEQWNNIAIELR